MAMAIPIAGAVIAAYGQSQQADAAAAGGKAQLVTAYRTAALQKFQGAQEEARQQKITDSLAATGAADVGASGATYTGSPLMALVDQVRQGTLQSIRTKNAYDQNAENIRKSGDYSLAAGFNKQQGYDYAAGGSILEGFGKAYRPAYAPRGGGGYGDAGSAPAYQGDFATYGP